LRGFRDEERFCFKPSRRHLITEQNLSFCDYLRKKDFGIFARDERDNKTYSDDAEKYLGKIVISICIFIEFTIYLIRSYYHNTLCE